jgi:glycerophosphoryl diester phosphodiesterase
MTPLIVAHRGASFDAPENTLRAFRLGWEQGADAIEADFHLTRDGQIACMHDPTTGRTGDTELKIGECTLEQLRKLDVGLHRGTQFAGERIPTLAEVLATVPKGGKVFLELKSGPAIVGAVRTELYRTQFLLSQLMIISFDSAVLAEAKRRLPQVKTSWLCGFHGLRGGPGGRHWTPSIEEILKVLHDCRADGLDCNAHECVDRQFVGKLREAGKEFHAWTVDLPATARRFADLGVDSITTNCPGAIRASLQT